jgi:hypothetical protein
MKNSQMVNLSATVQCSRYLIMFLLAPAVALADARLTVGPLPEPLISAESCQPTGTSRWGWDGTQSCWVTNVRMLGESQPLVQTRHDFGGTAFSWQRADFAGRTLRCDRYRRLNVNRDNVLYIKERYDITFLNQDSAPASAIAEDYGQVTAHLYTRGWTIGQFGRLHTGLELQFNRGVTTADGYILFNETRRSLVDDYLLDDFSHCYYRDSDEPLRSSGYCVDYDGDGIGWNGHDACEVQPVDPACDYSQADIGSNYGWGYHTVTGDSCPPAPGTSSYVPLNECRAGSDGWGWNEALQQSCFVGD